MTTVSIFNNKGGVGKTTLTFHLGWILSEMGKKVIFVDLDPQCNLTLHSMTEGNLESIWSEEEPFIESYGDEREIHPTKLDELAKEPRSIHFLLKPAEDGVDSLNELPPLIEVSENLWLLPGRLSLHQYEGRLAQSDARVLTNEYDSVRVVSELRTIIDSYAKQYSADLVLIDTSPSLGMLNKYAISFSDAFFSPTSPDIFSAYALKNIGVALRRWSSWFNSMHNVLNQRAKNKLPKQFVKFIGYAVYNARRAGKGGNDLNNLARAHRRYYDILESVVESSIPKEFRIDYEGIEKGVNEEVMFTHNTFPAMAQALKCPMWLAPDKAKDRQDTLESLEIPKPQGSHIQNMRETRAQYKNFAIEFLKRVEVVEAENVG